MEHWLKMGQEDRFLKNVSVDYAKPKFNVFGSFNVSEALFSLPKLSKACELVIDLVATLIYA